MTESEQKPERQTIIDHYLSSFPFSVRGYRDDEPYMPFILPGESEKPTVDSVVLYAGALHEWVGWVVTQLDVRLLEDDRRQMFEWVRSGGKIPQDTVDEWRKERQERAKQLRQSGLGHLLDQWWSANDEFKPEVDE